jgi:serpin B
MHVYRMLTLVLVLALAAGCAPSPAAFVPGQALQSQQQRQPAPEIPQADRDSLANGNAAFALDLYRNLADDGNLFFSPYSISLALAMTYAGARGDTAAQMADTLHFTLPPEQLHPALNALSQELASRKESSGEGADGKGFRLNIANDIWGQKDAAFQQEFLDLLARNYGAGLRLMDFQNDPEAARKVINDAVARQTEDRIQNLIPEGAIDELTRLVLTNAIYFNAAWRMPFEKSATADAPFTTLDGTQVTVPMMAGTKHFRHLDGDGFQAVVLPYENQNLSMLVLVPDAGAFSTFTAGLDSARLNNILADMQGGEVILKMPKFRIEDEFSLKPVLTDMGMTDAFQPGQADFSGIDGTRDLYVSAVVHKSYVAVDEAGTEAAAATAVIVGATSMPLEPFQMTIDRPFLFLIRDEPTGAILFFGQVTNPNQ